jgi:hypothetical protein
MKKITLFITLFYCLISANAQKGKLFLTQVNKEGDCVSSGIFSSKSKLDSTKICSITEWCGDNQMYIGLNGITYQLERIGKRPTKYPYLTGTFKNKSLVVVIQKTKLTEKLFFDETSKSEENIMNYSYEVLITIKKGKKIVKIKAEASEGI